MHAPADFHLYRKPIEIAALEVLLAGELTIPAVAKGIVLFAHKSGSGRTSPRNRAIARALHGAGHATLSLDLLTLDEDAQEQRRPPLELDVAHLATRLVAAVDWLAQSAATRELSLGLLGASTAAAAGLHAAAARPDFVRALVSQNGRPDLAAESLEAVRAPGLWIVGGDDRVALENHRRLCARTHGSTRLAFVPHAERSRDEARTLEHVARLAAEWFSAHLDGAPEAPRRDAPCSNDRTTPDP